VVDDDEIDSDECSSLAAVSVSLDQVPTRSDDIQHDALIRYTINKLSSGCRVHAP